MSDINATATAIPQQSLRERLIKKGQDEAKPEEASLFGEMVHIRRPTIGRIIELQDIGASVGTNEMMASAIIMVTYDPTTNRPLFTSDDKAAIMEWPFSEDVRIFSERIGGLVGLNVASAEKNSAATLTDTSS